MLKSLFISICKNQKFSEYDLLKELLFSVFFCFSFTYTSSYHAMCEDRPFPTIECIAFLWLVQQVTNQNQKEHHSEYIESYPTTCVDMDLLFPQCMCTSFLWLDLKKNHLEKLIKKEKLSLLKKKTHFHYLNDEFKGGSRHTYTEIYIVFINTIQVIT